MGRFLIISGALVVVLLSVYAVLLAQATKRLNRQLERRRQAGWPDSVEDIIPETPPAEDNAAILYNEAIRLRTDGAYQEGGDGSGAVGAFATLEDLWPTESDQKIIPDDPEEAEKVRIALADPKVADAIELLLAARDRPRCVFTLDYEQGPGTLLPHLTHMRGFARILGQAAMVAAADGDSDRSTEMLLTILQMAKHGRQEEPLLITHLVALAIDGIACRTLREATARTPFTANQLARLQIALEDRNPRQQMLLATDGEALLTVPWIQEHFWQQFATANATESKMRDVIQVVARPWIDADMAVYLEGLARLREQIEQPARAADPQAIDAFAADTPKYAVMTRMLLPVLGKISTKVGNGDAVLTTAATGCALLRYEADHGEFPESLDALVPAYFDAVPTNPLSGRPLPYERTPTGWQIPNVLSSRNPSGWTWKRED